MSRKTILNTIRSYAAGTIISLIPVSNAESTTNISNTPSLETRVLQIGTSDKLRPQVLEAYEKIIPNEGKQEIDYLSKKIVNRVPNKQISSFGSFVYGHFRTDTKEITDGYGPAISGKEEIWTAYHESAHAIGIFDETKADAYAMSQTGHNPRPLGFNFSLPKS